MQLFPQIFAPARSGVLVCFALYAVGVLFAADATAPAQPARALVDMTPKQEIYAVLQHYDDLVGDFNRPRWHLASPDYRWWDMNGGFEIDGQYHISFLRTGFNADSSVEDLSRGKRWTWGHATSRDLFHWRFRPDTIPVADAAKTPNIYSGHSVYDAPKPTIIVYVLNRGVFVLQAKDSTLSSWEYLNNGEPVIPSTKEKTEFFVFDPFAWYDAKSGLYYAFIGNHNKREGYSASPSLFTSKDLVKWDYVGPVLKDQPGWLTPQEDTACVDFFPLGGGGKWVMINHVHFPYFHTRAMVGTFDGAEFTPERLIRLGGLQAVLFAPETFYDAAHKRRVYFGTVAVSGPGWATAATQPLELKLSPEGELEFHTLKELESLAFNKKSFGAFALDGVEKPLEGAGSLSMRLAAAVDVGTAKRVGFKLACAPDASEYAVFEYLPEQKIFRIDFSKSRAGADARVEKYSSAAVKKGLTEKTAVQDIPFALKPGEKLRVQIFRDGALFEVIVNGRAFTAQPIYSAFPDSVQVRAFAEGGRAEFESVETCDIDASMSL